MPILRVLLTTFIIIPSGFHTATLPVSAASAGLATVTASLTWEIGKTHSLDVHANLVVLAIDVVLATVGVPARLSKMKKMPAIHVSHDNSDFAIPGLNEAVRRVVAVVLVHFAGCSNYPSLHGAANHRAASLKSSRCDIFPGFVPSLYLNTSSLWNCSSISAYGLLALGPHPANIQAHPGATTFPPVEHS